MTQQQEYNEETGYRAVEKYRSNLDGIINEIKAIKKYKIDTTSIEERLNKVDKELKKLEERINKLSLNSEAMIRESEGFILGPSVKELKDITEDYRRNIKPLYEIYTLLNEINETIIEIGDINRVEELSKILINSINNIDTHNNVDVTTLVDAAYHSIFDALQYETVYEKDNLLQYITSLNLSSNKEYLGKIIRNSISKNNINERLIKEEKLKHLDEGAEYDYISQDILKELSKKNFSHIYKKIQEEKTKQEVEKENQIRIYNNKYNNIVNNINSLRESIKKDKLELNINKLKLLGLRSTLAAYVIIPTLTIGCGYEIGKEKSEKINEYATVTREIELDTNKVIKEVSCLITYYE